MNWGLTLVHSASAKNSRLSAAVIQLQANTCMIYSFISAAFSPLCSLFTMPTVAQQQDLGNEFLINVPYSAAHVDRETTLVSATYAH